MRILGGSHKNQVIKVPKTARPTSAKIRESLFHILKNQIEGSCFLDLFSGSAIVGIEALSRGANQVLFVEKDKAAIQVIRKNLKKLDLEKKAEIFHMDALKAVKLLCKKERTFDLIYIDPPYDLNITSLLPQLFPLLKKQSLLIFEQRKNAMLNIPFLKKVDTREYGDTLLYFFARSG